MERHLKDILFVSGLLFVFAFLFFILWLLSNWAESKVCERHATKMSMNYTYDYVAGCMIEYEKGKWIPKDHYRINE